MTKIGNPSNSSTPIPVTPSKRSPSQPTTGSWITIRKVVAVACVALLISNFYLRSSENTALQTASVSVLGGGAAIALFAPHVARGIHPGLMTNTEGNRFCVIPENIQEMFAQKECDEIALQVEAAIFQYQPDQYQQIVDEMATDYNQQHAKGFKIGNFNQQGSSIEFVTIQPSFQKLSNYKKVLNLIERTVIGQVEFFEQAPEAIVETVKKTHELLFRKVPMLDGMPGEFRAGIIIVTGDHVDKDFEGFRKELKKNGGTAQDFKNFRSFWKKMQTYFRGKKSTNEGFIEKLTAAEKETFKKIGHIGVAPQQVEEEMVVFAKNLKKKVSDMAFVREKVIETAAFAHQQIVNIHPFEDGNGRIARAWMEGILQRGGVSGVIFPNDDRYAEAIETDRRGGRKFSAFLEETIEWNERQTFG